MTLSKDTLLKASVLLTGFISIFLLNRRLYTLEYQLLLVPAILYFLLGFIFFKFSSIIPREPVLFSFLLFCGVSLLSIWALFMSFHNVPIRTPGILLISIFSYAIGIILARPHGLIVKIGSLFTWIILLYYVCNVLVPMLLFHKNYSEANDKFPSFALYKSNEELIDPKNLNNKVILLDFWWTGCGPCIQKFKVLDSLTQHYRNTDNVAILCVTLGRENTYEDLRKFMNTTKYKNLVFVYDSANKLSNQLKIDGVPYEFIIDKKGNTRIINSGYSKDIEEIYLTETIKSIDNLLKE